MSRSPRVGKCRYSVARRRPAPGAANPVGHHVTNTVLTLTADGTVTAGSTFLGVRGDGTVASGVYEDTVVRTPAGWRISHRVVRARRTPLVGGQPGVAGRLTWPVWFSGSMISDSAGRPTWTSTGRRPAPRRPR